MKSQRIILRAVLGNTEIPPYLKALQEINNDPNILEAFFVLLAQRKLSTFFKDNESTFFSLSKKLEYDPTDLIQQYNDSNIQNDHLYFSLMKAFSQEEEGTLLWSLKDKLK